MATRLSPSVGASQSIKVVLKIIIPIARTIMMRKKIFIKLGLKNLLNIGCEEFYSNGQENDSKYFSDNIDPRATEQIFNSL